jgi:hypothetical protein
MMVRVIICALLQRSGALTENYEYRGGYGCT